MQVTLLCATCGNPFQAKRRDAKYCADSACKKAGGRREQAKAGTEKVRMGGDRLVSLVERDVAKYGYVDDAAGHMAVELALSVASVFSTASQKVAAVTKLQELLKDMALNPLGAAKVEEKNVDSVTDLGAAKLRLVQ